MLGYYRHPACFSALGTLNTALCRQIGNTVKVYAPSRGTLVEFGACSNRCWGAQHRPQCWGLVVVTRSPWACVVFIHRSDQSRGSALFSDLCVCLSVPQPRLPPPLTHSDGRQQTCSHPGDLGPLSGWFNNRMVRLWAISHPGHFLIPDIW